MQYLDNIDYYRLTAYMYPLLKVLYRFDKKLRLLMFNEIEKIEIAIRRAVMQITADNMWNGC